MTSVLGQGPVQAVHETMEALVGYEHRAWHLEKAGDGKRRGLALFACRRHGSDLLEGHMDPKRVRGSHTLLGVIILKGVRILPKKFQVSLAALWECAAGNWR